MRPWRLRGRYVLGCVVLMLATSGTSYAAVHLANGAVTTKVLAKNAVTSAKIKNGSVQTRDLGRSVVPQDGLTWIGHREAISPVVGPDSGLMDSYPVQVPRHGQVAVTYFVRAFAGTCSDNPARLGLYVDGQPIANTAVPVWGTPDEPETTMTGGTFAISPGSHTFAMGVDCPDGSQGLLGWAMSTWTVSLQAQRSGP